MKPLDSDIEYEDMVGDDDGADDSANIVDVMKRKDEFRDLLIRKRKDAIDARTNSGVEYRWLEDQNNYHGVDANARREEFVARMAGKDAIATAKSKNQAPRASVFVQMVRARTNSGRSRLSEKLFPSHEKNWNIEPTPRAELVTALKKYGHKEVQDKDPMSPTHGQVLKNPDTGANMTEGDLIKEEQDKAEEACEKMEQVIDDDLVECGYNREGRAAIADAAMLGTCIMKGPIITTKLAKRYKKTMTADNQKFWDMVMEPENRPVSKRVDPWNFWPAPGCLEDIQAGGHCWERELMGGQGLRNLSLNEGYDKKVIAEILRRGPQNFTAVSGAEQMRRGVDGILSIRTHDRDQYELWTYTGDVSIDDLELFGTDLNGDGDTHSDKQMLSSRSAVIVMCNDEIIKMDINPMDTGELPYDVFCWERVPGSPWGVGIPYLMRYAQQTLNAAWRAMLDNAGLSHGPQVVIDRTKVVPANNVWDLHGRKIWFAQQGVDDVRKAFQVFNIDSQQEQLQAIIELSRQFGDEEANSPAIMQGEQGTATDRVGGMTLLANTANVVINGQVRNWDDSITSPHITRYYDWEMQYHDDETIKGDYKVNAIGATHLIVRDQQKQDLANFVSLSQSTPEFKREVHPGRLMKEMAKATELEGIMRTKDELIKYDEMVSKQPPPVAPAVEAAKIRAEAAIQAEKVEAESEQMNIQLRAQSEERNDEREMIKLQQDIELKLLEFAHESGMQLEEVKSKLSLELMKRNADLQKEQLGATKDIMGSFEQPAPQPVAA